MLFFERKITRAAGRMTGEGWRRPALLSGLLWFTLLFLALLPAGSGGSVPLLAATNAGEAELLSAAALPDQGLVYLRAEHGQPPAPILATDRLLAGQQQSAPITVNFIGSWPPSAQNAFNYAAGIWSSLVYSDVPIVVQAEWASLPSGVLGGAAAATLHRNFPNAPMTNTWYPVATANALAGSDLNGPDPEIYTIFNSSFPYWYFGVDGNTPSNQWDFATVVLHEIGHGLGFFGSMRVQDGLGNWGYGTPYPFIYDRFAINGSGQSLINTALFPNPSTALANQLTSNNVYFNGPKAVAVNNNQPVKLFAPSSWQQGSSYSHLDAATFNGTPHALMTPYLTNGEVIHNPGSLTLAIFEDLGWQTPANTPPAIEQLPDQFVPAKTTVSGAIDLWAYTTDVFYPPADLTFTIDNNPNPNAGVSISQNRYVDIFPDPDWTGETMVTVGVANPNGLSDSDTFTVVVANTPPNIATLPTQMLEMNTAATPALDLWAYTHDYQAPNEELTFTLDNSPAPEAGVTLRDNRYIDLQPDEDWLGQTNVSVRAEDPEGLSETATFLVIVVEEIFYAFLPIANR